MTLNSMTGFARTQGALDTLSWTWELKSVNGKAFEVRLRLPPGFDGLEFPARNVVANLIKRGTVFATLNVVSTDQGSGLKVNEKVLAELTHHALALAKQLKSAPPQAEALLGLRGVLEIGETVATEEALLARDQALLASLEQATAALAKSRRDEGARLQQFLIAQLSRIARLAKQARDNPARHVDAIRARLKDQVARLMDANSSFDEQRLHQEAVLLATRADIQEELDRLDSHIEAARALLASSEPMGRKFDFLAQEFNREANTLCSKANDKSLTAIGLELKTVIDQMREQVQNIE